MVTGLLSDSGGIAPGRLANGVRFTVCAEVVRSKTLGVYAPFILACLGGNRSCDGTVEHVQPHVLVYIQVFYVHVFSTPCRLARASPREVDGQVRSGGHVYGATSM